MAIIIRMAAGFQNVIEANQVCFHIGIRICNGISNASLRAKVHHNFRLILLKDRFDHSLISQITFYEAEIFKPLQFLQTCFFQAHVIVIVHVVQTHDLDTLHCGEQPLCKVGTNETRYTRDKNAFVFQINFCFIFHHNFSYPPLLNPPLISLYGNKPVYRLEPQSIRRPVFLFSMPQQAHLECLENDFPIHPEAALLDIFHIQIHPLLKREVVAVRSDLPIAAQAWRHIQTLLLIIPILLHLAGQGRPRANNAHITLQDVPKLRKLIQTRLANKPAHASNSRVVLDFEHRAVHFILAQKVVQFCFRIRTHGTKLVEPERFAISSNAFLRKNGPGRRVIYR